MPAWLTALLPLLQILYANVAPELKKLALTEIQNLEAQNTGHPFLEMALRLAEQVVADLPAA